MSFFKGASIYLVSNIVNAVIPFLLLPILTRYLSPAEYGQIAMFQMLLSGIATFIGLNAVGAANRKFYDGDVDDIIIKRFNGSCIQILVFSSIIALICIFLFQDILSEFLSIPTSWIIISIVISASTFIIMMRLGQWQIRNQAKLFGFLQVSNSLVNMLLSLVFIIFMNHGVQGRVDAQLITGILIAIIALVYLYKDKLIQVFIWEPKYIKEALTFGVPLIPHHIGFFFISAVDRFVINQKLGLTEAGIYMVAVQLSSSMAIVFDAINKAYVPWLFERLKRNNSEEKKQIIRNTYLYFILAILISLLAFMIGPFFINILAGKEYKDAGRIIGLLCLGQAFGGMYLMVTNYIFYKKETIKLSLITFTIGLVNVFLLYIFVIYFDYGLFGAALSFLLSKVLQFFMTWYISYLVYPLSWFKFNS